MKNKYKFIDMLDLGNPCNQNCRQCYYTGNKQTEIVSKPKTIEFIKLLKNNNNLTNEKFYPFPKEISQNFDFVELMAQNGIKKVLTNGNMNKEKNLEFIKILKNNNIEEIRTTLFSTALEQNLRNRNNQTEYEQIKRNIRSWVREKFIVTIRTIVSPNNIDRFESFYKELNKLGVNNIDLLKFIASGNGQKLGNKNKITEKDLRKLMQITDKLIQKGGKLRIKYSAGFGPDFAKQKPTFVRNRENICDAINTQALFISSTSKQVYRCFFAQNKSGQIGKVTDEGKIMLDQNLIKKLSERSLVKSLKGICSGCENKYTCIGGCRVNAVMSDKDKNIYAGQDICRTIVRKKFDRT